MPKALDLTGKHFNMITVIKKCDYKDEKNNKVLWLCRCDCPNHTEFTLNTQQITKEIPYSCGCTNRPKAYVKYDLEGQVFGKLTVKEYVGNGKWRCVCSCNGKNEKIISGETLRRGKAKSCGKCIMAHKDLTGQVFGHVMAVKYLYTNSDNRAVWDCVCECGRHDIFDSHSLSDKRLVNRTCKYCRSEKMSKLKQNNLIGRKYGDLIVTDFAYVKNGKTYWKCFCTRCNNDGFIVQGKRLKNGNTKSCGCRRHRSGEDNPKFKSIAGNVYDHLTAVRYDHTDKYGHPHWVFFL